MAGFGLLAFIMVRIFIAKQSPKSSFGIQPVNYFGLFPIIENPWFEWFLHPLKYYPDKPSYTDCVKGLLARKGEPVVSEELFAEARRLAAIKPKKPISADAPADEKKKAFAPYFAELAKVQEIANAAENLVANEGCRK